MTDKVLCPWCGTEMVVSCAYDFVDGVRSATEICVMCGARGPKKCAVDMDEAKEAARAAALRRYEPPVRPLAIEEVIEISHEEGNIVYLDFQDEQLRRRGYNGYYEPQFIKISINNCKLVDAIDFYAPGCESERTFFPDEYGRTWRCWPRNPTVKEWEAYGWEDAE